mmetsp:Transcript_43619/g.76418  ORF Transcript_43619/g.76418 Transcript_43619/m.76418 type:complete len:371 (+) Transcript_43619:53-1165(+)
MPPLVKLRLRGTFIDFYPEQGSESSLQNVASSRVRSSSSPPGCLVAEQPTEDLQDLPHEYLSGLICRMMQLSSSTRLSGKDSGGDPDSQSTASQAYEVTDQCVSEQDAQSSAGMSQTYSAEGSVSEGIDLPDSASPANRTPERIKKSQSAPAKPASFRLDDGSQQASCPHGAQQCSQSSPIQHRKPTLLLQLCLDHGQEEMGEYRASASKRNQASPVAFRADGGFQGAELLAEQGAHEVQDGTPPQGIVITTLMIRNIPCKVKMKALLELLGSKGFAGAFDFLYLPVRGYHSSNLGYAFINFKSAATVAPFMLAFNGVAFSAVSGIRTEKVIEIRPARVQGLAGKIAVVRQIMTKDDENSLFIMQESEKM